MHACTFIDSEAYNSWPVPLPSPMPAPHPSAAAPLPSPNERDEAPSNRKTPLPQPRRPSDSDTSRIQATATSSASSPPVRMVRQLSAGRDRSAHGASNPPGGNSSGHTHQPKGQCRGGPDLSTQPSTSSLRNPADSRPPSGTSGPTGAVSRTSHGRITAQQQAARGTSGAPETSVGAAVRSTGGPSRGPMTPEEGIDECLGIIGSGYAGSAGHASQQAGWPSSQAAAVERAGGRLHQGISAEVVLAVHRLNM